MVEWGNAPFSKRLGVTQMRDSRQPISRSNRTRANDRVEIPVGHPFAIQGTRIETGRSAFHRTVESAVFHPTDRQRLTVDSGDPKRGLGNAVQYLEGVMADVVSRHLLANESFADFSGLEAAAKHPKEEGLLFRIRVGLVAAE